MALSKLLLTIICLLAFVLYPEISISQDERLKGLEDELDEILAKTYGAGFSVAIVEKDSLIYARGYGFRDLENKIKADENTLYAIGSCSKAFTSSILGILEDEEKLDFEESPRKYIPELEFVNKDLNNNIQVKDLLCHRTGLPRHDFSWYLFPTFSKDSLLQRIRYHEPFTGVRTKWYYNNFMFLTQGVIAEKITGKSWEDNVRDQLFKPLGMIHSNFSIAELEESENASFGYEIKNDSIISKMDYYNIAAMGPAGSINSSVKEMGNWLKTWINGGKFEGEQIIPSKFVKDAIGSQMVIGYALPDEDTPELHFSNYGYAWFLSSYKGHYRVQHGGNIDGFSANTAFFPSDSIGIVVLSNQNGSAIPSLVRNTIADRMLDEERTDWLGNFLEEQEKNKAEMEEGKVEGKSSRVENTNPSHILEEYTGTYSNPGYGNFEIVMENDSLYANFKIQKWFLKHYHYDVFEPFEVTETGIDTSESGPLRVLFQSNSAGDISGLNMMLEPTLDPINFDRTPFTIDISSEELDKYVGEYDLPGMTCKFYTKEDEDVLYLMVPGQPEYELLATSEHNFAIKVLEGFDLEFTEDENGNISEVFFIQPNGTFKAKRKEK